MEIPHRAVSKQNQMTSKNTTIICSSFIKNVYLHDWWLIKAEIASGNKQLGVGGFSSRESRGIRAFRSAAIAKRHDTVTLETVDGITITLSGLINMSLTHQSGFPSEICNHFRFGFPYCWEVYAAQCFDGESSNDGVNSSLPTSLDDLPVTRIHDILLSTLGGSENSLLTKNIFNDILWKYSEDNGASDHSNMKNSSSKTPSDQKLEVTRKFRGDESISNATDTEREMGVQSSSKRIATRSMTRLKSLKNKQEQNLSVNLHIKNETCEPISAAKVSGNQSGGIRTGSDSNRRDATIIPEKETEAKETPNESPVKSLGKRKTLSKSLSTSEASRNQRVGMVAKRNISIVFSVNIPSEHKKKVEEAPDDATIVSKEETEAKETLDEYTGKMKTLGKSFSTKEDSRNQCVGKVTRGRSSNVFCGSTLSEQEKKVEETSYMSAVTRSMSAVRRSKRLKNLIN